MNNIETCINNEVTLYYAAVTTDRLSEKGNVVCDEYIFHTEQEALESGLDCTVATWADINMFADCGYFFFDMVICTPQGKFVLETIYANEEEREWDTPSKCVYRAHRSSVRFSEAVESYLCCNKGSELISIMEADGVFRAEVKNIGGEVIIINGG